jgi:hypothetical protein
MIFDTFSMVVGMAGGAGHRNVDNDPTTTGNYSATTTTECRGLAENTGNYGAALSTRSRSRSIVKGVGSVAVATGHDSVVKASKGSAICLVFRDENQNILHIRASKVGENGIQPNKWYKLNFAGEFVEYGSKS